MNPNERNSPKRFTVLVCYRVRPECLEEHLTLVRDVFSELAQTAPPGLRYGRFRRADGRSFVHVAFTVGEKNPLDTIAAFKAFGARIKERCDELPEVVELSEVGSFGLAG
jgi:hypothetical protein